MALKTDLRSSDDKKFKGHTENNNVKDGDLVFTSGKEGIFSPGLPIGEVKKKDNINQVLLFSNLEQITFVNIETDLKKNK